MMGFARGVGAWVWLRALAVVMIVFTAGHTMGVLSRPSNAVAAAELETMRRARFEIMGFDRSYFEFYRGFGLFVSVEFVLVAALAWQLAAISRRSAGQALPLAVLLEAACIATAVLSVMYFFAAPIVLSIAAVVLSTAALLTIRRDAQLEAAA